jgi:hypothetical protein
MLIFDNVGNCTGEMIGNIIIPGDAITAERPPECWDVMTDELQLVKGKVVRKPPATISPSVPVGE